MAPMRIFRSVQTTWLNINARKSEQDGWEKTKEGLKDEHLNTMGYLLSLAGQLSHREGCMDLIRKEEANTKKQFDTVILSRADLTIYGPFKPYCMYNLSVPRRFQDWFFMVPRSLADDMFTKLHADFYECRKPLTLDVVVESYESSILAASQQDASLPVLVTRENHPDMPNNICEAFTNPERLPADPAPGELCGHLTFENNFNHPASLLKGNCAFLKPHEFNGNENDKSMPLCGLGGYSWNCMSGNRGGRVQCPRSAPIMCAEKSCDEGQDYCCDTNCGPHGGPRLCESA